MDNSKFPLPQGVVPNNSGGAGVPVGGALSGAQANVMSGAGGVFDAGMAPGGDTGMAPGAGAALGANAQSGVGVQPGAVPGVNAQPGVMPMVQFGQNGMANNMNPVNAQSSTVAPEEKRKKIVELVKTIAIVVLSLIAVTFIGLFIWMFVRYNEESEDVEGQINTAVAEAKYEQAVKLETEFAEREKEPYRTFTGPADYGQLSFKYPKTWSVYVEADATKGGDFRAFFNPIQVDMVSNNTINALRVSIVDKPFDEVAAEYQRVMEDPESNLRVEATTVSGVSANMYIGTIPDSELSGYIVIFKIRDKTAIMQTDATVFKGDFDAVLQTVTFNA